MGKKGQRKKQRHFNEDDISGSLLPFPLNIMSLFIYTISNDLSLNAKHLHCPSSMPAEVVSSVAAKGDRRRGASARTWSR